ncbi:hypothetical protein [Ferruginibacter albus]|uniref:hypothetical protein n=1 Tax=Ferruginibacter albus TaxID=2875540 RepID=UPI001CC5F9E3|nr:hypothetical protein [Ferruginibacter albus]UAY50802.1 hypothetical protein K9M53_09385 [Ferruginibacter albus]
MKKLFISILYFFIVSFVFGQKSKKTKLPSPVTTQTVADNSSCIKKKYKSFSDRLKNYPFNISTQIQFVSFPQGIFIVDNEIIKKDTAISINDSLLYSRLTEVKTLTYQQVDKLTDILYDHGYKGTLAFTSERGCYNPRNAILFLNNNKVVGIIEICFECQEVSKSDENISLGEICDEKLSMIYDLFKKVGIEYGVTKGVRPGD